MILEVVALLMIVDGEIKEHRIQIDLKVWHNVYVVKVKHAKRQEKGDKIQHQCIKSMAEVEQNIDGSLSIKKLILE